MATNTRGPRELIDVGVNGVMFEVNDIEGTAKAIEQLYAYKRYDVVSEEKAKETTNKFLLENVLAQLNCVYEELYKESNAALS